MPALAQLNVDFNALTTLPASLAKSRNLVLLYAIFNQITDIPEVLLKHPTLSSFDLSTNNLTSIPQVQIPSLRYFFMVNNSLRMLPSGLFNLPLVRLAVDGNLLTSLPSDIGNLGRTLNMFTVSQNNMTFLPSSMGQLINLEVLDIRNNSLASLPSWNELTSLVHLTVAGNPLCENGWLGSGRVRELMEMRGEGCTPQCSDMCLNSLLTNFGCDYQCNVPNCDFDNGMCMSNENS